MTEYDENVELNAGDEGDYTPSAPPAKRRQGLLIGVLALLILGGGGFFAWTMFMPVENTYTPPPMPPAPLAPAESVPAPVAEIPADPSLDTMAQAETPPAPEMVAEAMPTPVENAEAVLPEAVTPPLDPAAQPDLTPPSPEAVVETTEAVNEALAATETVPAAPPQQQLQPIDPVSGKQAAAADAVKEILGADAKLSPEQKDAQLQNIAEQVEVTPRAKQVIVVKKAYSAQSGPAVNAAGGRVLAAGNYNDAVAIYDSQLARNPSDPIALAGKALALQKAGRDAEALELYRRLLDLNPRDLDALTNYLGLLQKQKPEEALTRLETLQGQYPESALIAGQIAMASATLADTPRALKSFQKAIALDPTNPVYPFNMAVLYDRLGTVDKAREAYLQSLRLVRDYPEKEKSVPVNTIRQRLRGLSS